MILTISAPQFDIEGSAVIAAPNERGLIGFERRNSRVATLDGRAEINDFGYSDADRTLDIQWRPDSRDQIDNVVRMAKAYSRLIVSTQEGVFTGAPGPFSLSSGEAQLRIYVERRLDQ